MAEGEIYDSEGVRIELNQKAFTEAIYEAFNDYVHVLEAQFTKEIGTVQFSWPRSTNRGMGKQKEEIGSPRDIVDSGFFRESISVYQGMNKGDRGTATFVWNAPYSKAILTGYKKKQQWPARDWIAKALKNKPPLETIRKSLGGAT